MSDEIEDIQQIQPKYEADELEAAAKALEGQISWAPVIKKLGINLFIPFINGIMLGFGEIFAHELGLIWGWRCAKVYDPSVSPATNPKARRKWLFGLL